MNNDILCFTETRIQQIQSHTNDLNLVFNGFLIYFNNNESKFTSVAYGRHDTITVIEKEGFPVILIVKFKKIAISEKALNLMIL